VHCRPWQLTRQLGHLGSVALVGHRIRILPLLREAGEGGVAVDASAHLAAAFPSVCSLIAGGGTGAVTACLRMNSPLVRSPLHRL